MRYLHLLLAPLLLLSLTLTAQASPESRKRADEIRRECVAFVTRECDLTAEEAHRLDAELTVYDRKRETLWRERADLLARLHKGEASDEEYGRMLDRVLELDIAVKECHRDFYAALKPHFDNRRLASIYLALRHFRHHFSKTHHT